MVARAADALRRQARAWIARRHQRRPGPVTLVRQRIYILPTRYGGMLGAMLFLMLLGAMNYSNSMVFAVTFLLTGLALVTMHHTHRNLLGLVVGRGAAEPVFAGQPAVFEIRLDNPGSLDRMSLTLESPDGTRRHTHLPAGERAVLSLYVTTRYRGRLQAPRFTLSTRAPLGLFRAWSWVHLDMTCIVYPRPADDAPAPPAGGRGDGEQAVPHAGGRDDFHGLRKYHAGDSFRHIAWKAVAREQDVMTKQFAETRDERHWLDWESLAGLPPERRLAILCRWVLDCDARGLDYGLALPGTTLAPGCGEAHRQRCLEALALLDTGGAA